MLFDNFEKLVNVKASFEFVSVVLEVEKTLSELFSFKFEKNKIK